MTNSELYTKVKDMSRKDRALYLTKHISGFAYADFMIAYFPHATPPTSTGDNE